MGFRVWCWSCTGRAAYFQEFANREQALDEARFAVRHGSPLAVVLNHLGAVMEIVQGTGATSLFHREGGAHASNPAASRVEEVSIDEVLGRGRHGS